MKSRQLVQLLTTLTREEHRALRRFALTPYFCPKTQASKLLIQLSQRISMGRYVPSSPEALFRMAGIKSKDAAHYFDNLQGMMVDTVLDFLTIERIRNNRLGWASEHALTLASHEASTVRGVSLSRKAMDNARASTTIEMGDQEFLIDRLRRTAEALNRNQVNSSKAALAGIQELLSFAQASGSVQNRKVRLYADLVRVIQTADKDEWTVLADSVAYIKKLMPKDEAHDFVMMLLSVAVRYVNEGSRDEYLNLVQRLDEIQLLSNKGRIDYPVYVNTAVTALHAQRYEWAQAFIDKYRRRLSGERAKEVYNEAMAVWYFYQYWKLGDATALDSSHNSLVKAGNVMHGDIFETYSARKLLFMIFTERGDLAAARSVVASTIRSLNHHKRELGTKHRFMMPFFRAAQRLVQLPASTPAMALKMAEHEIQELSHLPWFGSKDWIVEKLQSHAHPKTVLAVA